MIETALLAVALALVLHAWRKTMAQLHSHWHRASRFERILLVLVGVMLTFGLLIPGPLDELAAVVLLGYIRRRVARRPELEAPENGIYGGFA